MMTYLWTTVAILSVTSGVLGLLWYQRYPSSIKCKKKMDKRRHKKKMFVTPAWAVTKAQELQLTQLSTEQIESLNQRKPRETWNTVLFFPDFPSRSNSSSHQLIEYFMQARTSIYLCMYLCSHYNLSDVITKKFNEGLLVQVVTDFDTWTAHNSSGTKWWKKNGIEVRVRANGYLMHNKFAIIDEEAVLTGSLNWTKQGVESNNENVLVTTDQRITRKYFQEFLKLWAVSTDPDIPDLKR